MSSRGLWKNLLATGLAGVFTLTAVLPSSAQQTPRQTTPSMEQCWIPAGAMDIAGARGYGYWGPCSPGAIQKSTKNSQPGLGSTAREADAPPLRKDFRDLGIGSQR